MSSGHSSLVPEGVSLAVCFSPEILRGNKLNREKRKEKLVYGPLRALVARTEVFISVGSPGAICLSMFNY